MSDICARFGVSKRCWNQEEGFKFENERNLTLQNLTEDCQRFINVCQDAKDIEVNSVLHIKKVHQENKVKRKIITLNPCYTCEELHFYNDHPYKNKECFCCKNDIRKLIVRQKF